MTTPTINNKNTFDFKNFSKIEDYLRKLVKNYKIDALKIANDPEGEVSKIFIIKISENVSYEEKDEMRSEIIKKSYEYAEKNNLKDTIMDTAIIFRR